MVCAHAPEVVDVLATALDWKFQFDIHAPAYQQEEQDVPSVKGGPQPLVIPIHDPQLPSHLKHPSCPSSLELVKAFDFALVILYIFK